MIHLVTDSFDVSRWFISYWLSVPWSDTSWVPIRNKKRPSSDLALLDLGTSRDRSGGNLSLALRSSLEPDTYWESCELFLCLNLVERVGWLQPRYFILASFSRLCCMFSSSSLWVWFCCWSFVTRSSASASFFRNSGGTCGGWDWAGLGWGEVWAEAGTGRGVSTSNAASLLVRGSVL